MAHINVSFAELHNPLFFQGKNFSVKLDPGALSGLKLVYDTVEKELLVYWAGGVGHIPSANVAVYVPGEPKKPVAQIVHPMVAGLQSAQVETPMSHVHSGHGHGKTGRDK